MGVLSGIGTLIGSIGDVGTNIYNAIQNKKEFEYQKELNNTSMAREDSAIQRAAADAQAAGYNRIQALGQAAQSGSFQSASPNELNSSLAEAGASFDKMRLSFKQYKQLQDYQNKTIMQNARAMANEAANRAIVAKETYRHNKEMEEIYRGQNTTAGQSAQAASKSANTAAERLEWEKNLTKDAEKEGYVVMPSSAHTIDESESSNMSIKLGPAEMSGASSSNKPVKHSNPELNDSFDDNEVQSGPGVKIGDLTFIPVDNSFVVGTAGKEAFQLYKAVTINSTGNPVYHYAWYDNVSNKWITSEAARQRDKDWELHTITGGQKGYHYNY